MPQSVTLGPGIPSTHPATGEAAFIHHYHDETGARLGSVKVVPKDEGKTLQIPWIGQGPGNGGAMALGPTHIRSLLEQAKAMYPGAQRLTGLRVSGHRADKPIQDQAVSVKLERQSREWLAEKIKKLKAEGKPHEQAVAIALHMGGYPKKLSRENAEGLLSHIAAGPADDNAMLALADALREAGHDNAADRLQWFHGAKSHPGAEGPHTAVPAWVTALHSHREMANMIPTLGPGLQDRFRRLNHGLLRRAVGITEPPEDTAHLADTLRLHQAARHGEHGARQDDEHLAMAMRYAHEDLDPATSGMAHVPGQIAGGPAANDRLYRIRSFAKTNPPPE